MPLYLYLMLFTVSGPLIRSFESRIAYYTKFHALLIAIVSVGIPFLAHDIYFTANGYWGFNPDYLVGINIANLPIEEWSFFIIIPFTCIFCFEVFNYFLGSKWILSYARQTALVVGILLLTIGILHFDKAYTSSTGITAGILMIATFIWNPSWLPQFWRMYFVIVIPFLLVNGALTGSFTPEPVVWYNDDENLAIRAITIPVEDFGYNLILLFGNTAIYQWVKSKWPTWLPTKSGAA